MEGQPAAGELAGQEAVLQEICALRITGRRNSLVRIEVMKEANCLWKCQGNYVYRILIEFNCFMCVCACACMRVCARVYLADRKAGAIVINSLHDL